jgi:hypothetical protein
VITTEYGTWGDVGGSTVTVEDYIAVALGEHGEGFDVEAIASDFRKAVNEALPEGVSLNGNLFFGPHGVAAEDRPDLRETVDSVDFWEIAVRHDRAQ